MGGHDRGSQVAAKLDLDVPGILKAASRQLRDKSPKTRAGVFLILKELVVVAPVSVTRDIDQLMPGIIAALNVRPPSLIRKLLCPAVDPASQLQAAMLSKASIASCSYRSQQRGDVPRCNVERTCNALVRTFCKIAFCQLQDKSSSTSVLKIQALLFLGLALQRKREQQVRQPQIIKLAPPVFQAAADKYYKVAAEAIRVCEVLVTAIRPAAVQPLQPALQVSAFYQTRLTNPANKIPCPTSG